MAVHWTTAAVTVAVSPHLHAALPPDILSYFFERISFSICKVLFLVDASHPSQSRHTGQSSRRSPVTLAHPPAQTQGTNTSNKLSSEPQRDRKRSLSFFGPNCTAGPLFFQYFLGLADRASLALAPVCRAQEASFPNDLLKREDNERIHASPGQNIVLDASSFQALEK